MWSNLCKRLLFHDNTLTETLAHKHHHHHIHRHRHTDAPSNRSSTHQQPGDNILHNIAQTTCKYEIPPYHMMLTTSLQTSPRPSHHKQQRSVVACGTKYHKPRKSVIACATNDAPTKSKLKIDPNATKRGFKWDPANSRWLRDDRVADSAWENNTTVQPLTGPAYTVWPVMHSVLTDNNLQSLPPEEVLYFVVVVCDTHVVTHSHPPLGVHRHKPWLQQAKQCFWMCALRKNMRSNTFQTRCLCRCTGTSRVRRFLTT